MSDTGRDATEDDAAHLEDVPDGLGCAEVWEELSERRGEGTGNGESADSADEDAADADGPATGDVDADGASAGGADEASADGGGD